MNVGLIEIESKIFNTAYMQIAEYHKGQGDTVDWAWPLEYHLFDVLYCSSIFDFTPKTYVPKRAICGGTGFDIKSKLPPEIEECDYDYSIYPELDYSMVWFSRGCIRRCPFCVVPDKEGAIRPVGPKALNPNGKYIMVQDNNFFANPRWPDAISILQRWNQRVDFQQGIDIRLMDDEKCQALKSIKLKRFVRFAWDDPAYDIRPGLELMLKHFKPAKLFCYVLIGFNSSQEQDIARVELLDNHGVTPFVMTFDKTSRYQRRFARWVNRKWVFKSTDWIWYYD